MLVEGVGGDGHLHPFAPSGDDREDRRPGVGHPHVVLQLRHVLFGCRFFGERPRQDELGLEHGVEGIDESVQCCSEISMDGVSDPSLDVSNGSHSVAFVPAPVQLLGGDAQLDDEIARQVLRLGLAALFVSEPDQRRLVGAHDDPGIRAADDLAAVQLYRTRSRGDVAEREFHRTLPYVPTRI